MKYVTGPWALNMPCPSLGTPGDWHGGGYDWDKVEFSDTDQSVFGTWGVGEGRLPNGAECMIADHLRACLDLIERGFVGTAQGMREYYLADEGMTPIVFEKVMLLGGSPLWPEVDRFMGSEYGTDWLDYRDGRGRGTDAL